MKKARRPWEELKWEETVFNVNKTQLLSCVTQNSSAGPEPCPETQEGS